MDYIIHTTHGEELYHHGILGQKWGVRRFQNPDGTRTAAGKAREREESSSPKAKRTSSGSSERKGLTDKQKRIAKNVAIGAAVVAGTALAAYGAYKLDGAVKNAAYDKSIKQGEEVIKGYLYDTQDTYNSIMKSDIASDTTKITTDLLRNEGEKTLSRTAKSVALDNSSSFKRSIETLRGNGGKVIDGGQAYTFNRNATSAYLDDIEKAAYGNGSGPPMLSMNTPAKKLARQRAERTLKMFPGEPKTPAQKVAQQRAKRALNSATASEAKKKLSDFDFVENVRVTKNGTAEKVKVPSNPKEYAKTFATQMANGKTSGKDYDYWHDYMTKSLRSMGADFSGKAAKGANDIDSYTAELLKRIRN